MDRNAALPQWCEVHPKTRLLVLKCDCENRLRIVHAKIGAGSALGRFEQRVTRSLWRKLSHARTARNEHFTQSLQTTFAFLLCGVLDPRAGSQIRVPQTGLPRTHDV